MTCRSRYCRCRRSCLCRRWNWYQDARSAIGGATTAAVLTIGAVAIWSTTRSDDAPALVARDFQNSTPASTGNVRNASPAAAVKCEVTVS